ncbi:MBL fold metallo-hydrolase [Kribbella sp. NPDC051587]|uniref:MBL fold metallo-hydrolase n=1 Tax=Kribbella sp. NPDC051587 TaxID=3364119 RepID=UPI0037B4F61C
MSRPGGKPSTIEISEGVFAYVQPDGSWWLNNAGFIVGRRGVTSIDTCATEARTRAYQAAIRGVTSQPVRTIVNTHHHGDHTFGNYLFHDATIVGHYLVRPEMESFGHPADLPFWTPVDWGAIELEPPTLTYTDRVTIWSDELACGVAYVGRPAHTTNDSIVWIPERSVLFAGDLLFNGGTPFLLMGSVRGSIEVLEDVVEPLDATTIVPGHGDICGPEVIDDVLAYLYFVQSIARAGRAAGLSPLETALDTDLGEYAGLTDPERIVGNLHRAYAELEGAPEGTPLDIHTILGEMVAYTKGQRLRTFA